MNKFIWSLLDIPIYSPAVKQLACFILVFFFLPSVPLFCEPTLDLEHLTIRSFTCPDDLPNEVVRDVIMTRDGSVWIATWGGGIVVMNGTAKRLINKKNGLISDDVRVLEEDREGRVWVGTSAGVSCIQNKEIINFAAMPSLAIPESDSIFSIESIDNGEVWFGDGIGNLFSWVPSADSPDVQNGRWKLVNNFRDYMINNNVEECSIRKIEQYTDRSLWLAINYVGMVKINSPDELMVTVDRMGAESPFCFDFLIADATRQFRIDYRCLGVKDQVLGLTGYSSPANCKCVAYAFGVILLGTEQGLYYLDNHPFSPIPLTKNNRLYCIESISVLRDGSVWIGTRNGAFRITQTSWIPQRFSSKYTTLFNENYEPGFKQKALALDEGGRLWAYRDHAWNTIHQFEQTFVTTNTLYARSNQLLIQNATESVEFDLSQMKIINRFQIPQSFLGKYQTFIIDRQEIWYASPNGVFRKKGNDFVPVFDLPPDIDHEVYSILQTGPDHYWIGGKGWLGCYQDGKFEIVELPPLVKNNKASFIRSLQTKEGELWFSQLGQGILRCRGAEWYQDNQKNGLPSNYIMSLKQTCDGAIWAGDRNNGAMSFKDGRWIHYNDEDGIPMGPVSTMVEDEDGHLWIGLEHQYLRGSQYFPLILEYQPDRDPPAVQILSASTRLLPDSPGIFSFQGQDAWNNTPREQLVYSWRVLKKNGNVIRDWHPYTLDTSVVVPALSPGDYFFEVRAQDRHRNTSSASTAVFSVEPYFWMKSMFQIPAALAIFFAALSLYMNRKQYKQKMENRLLQEKMDFLKFCELSNIGMLRLTLAGELRSVNRAMAEICGFESERHMVEYPAPLQWKQPEQFEDFIRTVARPNSHHHAQLMGYQPLSGQEFYVFLYGNYKDHLLEIIALDLTQQMAVDRLVLQAQVEQQQKIGQDLHDSVVQDLTGIMNKVQILLEKNKQTSRIDIRDIEFLDRIVENSCLKIRQMSMGLSPMNFKEIDLGMALEEIRYDLEKAYPGPVYRFEIQPDIPGLDEKTEDHLYNIVHEALYNAARHSKATLISLKTETVGNRLILTVYDNGIGMDGKTKSPGLGLTNMRRRAGLLGAELSVNPHPDGGTIVQCRYSLPE